MIPPFVIALVCVCAGYEAGRRRRQKRKPGRVLELAESMGYSYAGKPQQAGACCEACATKNAAEAASLVFSPILPPSGPPEGPPQ